MTPIFHGYSKSGKPVAIFLTDSGRLNVVYTQTGAVRRLNDEYYSLEEAESPSMEMYLRDCGFRRS